MALITCPECGRENVSDSAEACPSCGYNIRKHFEKISVTQENEASKTILDDSLSNDDVSVEDISSVDTEQEPEEYDLTAGEDYAKGCTKRLLAGFILIVDILLIIFSLNEGSLLLTIIFICVAVVLCICVFSSSKGDASNIQQNSSNDYSIESTNTSFVGSSVNIVCPMCGSDNTERISTASRVVSTYMVGLASAKIGKQYKCNNCKHMW